MERTLYCCNSTPPHLLQKSSSSHADFQIDKIAEFLRITLLLSAKFLLPPTKIDFFLANPSLLHKTHLPLPFRRKVNALGIEKPEKHFLSFPSSQILFAQMEPLQTHAVRSMVAKGLIDIDTYKSGEIRLIAGHESWLPRVEELVADDQERSVAAFLALELAVLGRDVPGRLKNHTGLWRFGK